MTKSLEPLLLVPGSCSNCGATDRSQRVAVGEDFEYRTSPDSFEMHRCLRCDVVYLDPRPAPSELGRIYGPDYHAYDFTEERFGLSYRLRSAIERRRLLDWCGRLGAGARIIDIGAGDGFHLGILRDAGHPTWSLEGVEPDHKAAAVARAAGIDVHAGFIEELSLDEASYDFAIMIMVIEHVPDPRAVLEATRRILKPGGRIGIVTDNTDSPDARLGRKRHWGGYHFPRHFHLYNRRALADLAGRSGLEVERMETMMSPVNWTYTVHNALQDRGAPPWATRPFTLDSAAALAFFTVVDMLAGAFGNRALLRAVLRRPME